MTLLLKYFFVYLLEPSKLFVINQNYYYHLNQQIIPVLDLHFNTKSSVNIRICSSTFMLLHKTVEHVSNYGSPTSSVGCGACQNSVNKAGSQGKHQMLVATTKTLLHEITRFLSTQEQLCFYIYQVFFQRRPLNIIMFVFTQKYI